MLKHLPWCSWTPPTKHPRQHWRFVVACPPRSCDLAMPLFQQDMLTLDSQPFQRSTSAWCDASRHTPQDASAHQAAQHNPVLGYPFYFCSTQEITDIGAKAKGVLGLLLPVREPVTVLLRSALVPLLLLLVPFKLQACHTLRIHRPSS